jgi:hypothetical protein
MAVNVAGTWSGSSIDSKKYRAQIVHRVAHIAFGARQK